MLDGSVSLQKSGAQRYGFNLARGRFDMRVMEAFQDSKTARWSRDRLIGQVRRGELDNLLLKRLPGLESLSVAASERAAINIIDYHFEALVLQSMASSQLENYFRACQKVLKIGQIAGLDSAGPLWIDTVHHVCVFSVLYEFGVHLVRRLGYRKIILLHQGQRPEPRLHFCGKLMRERHGVPCTYIAFSPGWFTSLARQTTPDTAIFYLVDMPPEISRRSGSRRPPASVHLSADPNISITVETLSGSPVFSARLGATHVVLDYPEKDQVQLRTFNAANAQAHCPLEDWVFWPLLKAVDATVS